MISVNDDYGGGGGRGGGGGGGRNGGGYGGGRDGEDMVTMNILTGAVGKVIGEDYYNPNSVSTKMMGGAKTANLCQISLWSSPKRYIHQLLIYVL